MKITPAQNAPNRATRLLGGALKEVNRAKLWLAAAALTATVATSAIAGSATYDLNSDPTGTGLVIVGSAEWRETGGVGDSGHIMLTDNTGQACAVLFPDFDTGLVVGSFTFECMIKAGDWYANPPADGWSVNYARGTDPIIALIEGGTNPGRGGRADGWSGSFQNGGNEDNLPEEGTKTGLAIGFDTWGTGNEPVGGSNGGQDVRGISVKVDDNQIAQFAMPDVVFPDGDAHDFEHDATTLITGPFTCGPDPANPNQGDPTCNFGSPPAAGTALKWVPLKVQVTQDAKVSVWWKNQLLLDNFQTDYFASPGRIVFGGSTGGAMEYAGIDDIKITTEPVAAETEPPTMPGNLRAVEIGSRRALLEWDKSVDAPNPAAPVAYEVKRDGVVIQATTTALTFDDRGLQPNTSYSYEVTAMDLNQNRSPVASLNVTTIADVTGIPWGGTAEIWDNGGGASVDDLESSLFGIPNPNIWVDLATPDRTENAGQGLSFGDPGFGNTYGENLLVVMRGTVTPPVTGQYRFFIRSDDASQLFLNKTGAAIPDPGTEVLDPIAEEHGCCAPFEEVGAGVNPDGSYPTSEPVSLTAGQEYGFFFAVKEGGGGDWGQVAWRLEGDTTPAASLPAISGLYLKPLRPTDPGGASVTITQPPVDTEVIANQPVTFTGAYTFTSPYTTTPMVQWFKNGVPLLNQTRTNLTMPVAALSDNGAKIKFLVAVPGAQAEAEATLTVTADTKPPLVVEGGVHGNATLDGATVRFDEPVTATAANFTADKGLNITGATMLDAWTVQLTTSPQASGELYTLTINGVRDNAGNTIAPDTKAELVAFLVVVAGPIDVQIYDGAGGATAGAIPGTAVADLTSYAGYPGSPDVTATINAFNTRLVYADDSHENYGGRMTGLITPPQSGDYRFFTYSDDASEVWLSTDATEANLVKIAEETGCCHPFTEPDSPRTSAPIPLVAGQNYLLRGIWKEGGGGDYMFIAMRREGDPTPAASLVPIGNLDPRTGPPVVVVPPQSQEVALGSTVNLSAVVGMGERPLTYQWRYNDTDIPGATSDTLTIASMSAADAGSYDVVVSNSAGSGTSAAAVVTVTGTFLIEAEDFNYGSGQSNPKAGQAGLDVNVMPYLGGAYAGLGAKLDVDYGSNDGEDDTSYRAVAPSKGGEKNKDMNDNMGGRLGRSRGGWEVTTNFKLGWVDTADWGNYTRTIPAGNYEVLAALSHGNGPSDATALRGTLGLVTSDITTTGQTVEPLGKFVAPGTGGWGRNNYVRMTDDAGAVKTIALDGVETLRFTMDSGDFDYILLVPTAGGPPPGPEFTGIRINADGTITVEWTGGGTLQAAPTVLGPWEDVTGATSPYTFTPEGAMLFGRIRQ